MFAVKPILDIHGVVIYDRGYLFLWWHWLRGGRWVSALTDCERCGRRTAIVCDDLAERVPCINCGFLMQVPPTRDE